MTLRYALLLIGIVIIVVVALTAFDMARLRRPRSRPRPDVDFSEPSHGPAAFPPRVPPVMRAEVGEKILSPDVDVALEEKPRGEALRKEIRQLEEMATMPLNLTNGIQRRRRPRAEPGRQYLPDEKIDFVIDLPGAEPVARDTALGVFKQHEYILNKPRHLYGRHHGTERWSELQLDPGSTRYDDLKLAI